MTVEQGRNPLNHARRINATDKLEDVDFHSTIRCLRLALEILHNIQESVVHIRLINEPNLDLI